MNRAFILVLLLGWPALAQQFDLGLTSDPCSGGAAYTIPGAAADATLRYGSFSCTLTAPTVPYVLTLNFTEPTVGGPGQRLFHVLANDQVILDQFDLWASCGFMKPCSRSAVLPPSGGTLTLRFVTQYRSAVISSVALAPLSIPVSSILGIEGYYIAQTTTASGETCEITKVDGAQVAGTVSCSSAAGKSLMPFLATGTVPRAFEFGTAAIAGFVLLNPTPNVAMMGSLGPAPPNGIAWQLVGDGPMQSGSEQWP